jgi:hypothetical protein
MLFIILEHLDLSHLIGMVGIKISDINDNQVVLAHKSGAAICDVDKIEVMDLKNLNKVLEKELHWLYRTYPCYRHLWESESFSSPIKVEESNINEKISNKPISYNDTNFVETFNQESLF